MRNAVVLAVVLSIFLSSSACVGKKKFTKLLTDKAMIDMALEEAMKRLEECQENGRALKEEINSRDAQVNNRDAEINKRDVQIASKSQEIKALEKQLGLIEKTNNNLLDRLSDLSIVSKTGAESIQKSLESINQQGQYIQDLTKKIQAKDSTNLVLVMNLKRSLQDINDEDVQIEVRGSVVYISISDKLLFESGSAYITARAQVVLGKVAKIIKDHQTLEVMVEGHTDNVPIHNACVADNWDLSVKRATAIVRVLQDRYTVAPSRLTAAGRSQYVPKNSNNTNNGRALNRRTEIVLTPKLDEYFKLLEAPSQN